MTGPERDQLICFNDNPWIMWLPTALFGLVGGAFLFLGGQQTADPVLSAAAMGMGFVGIGFGVCAANRTERISVVFDWEQRRVTLLGILPWRTRRELWSFCEITDILVEQSDDGDGAKMWRPVIRLSSDDRIPMIAGWSHNEMRVRDTRDRAAAFLN